MLEQVNQDVTISVDASADGKRNVWTIHCEVVQHAKAYCVCIHLCKQRKEGRLPTQYSDCSAAIGKKECPALKMRKEELAEGRAIYFRERVAPATVTPAQWAEVVKNPPKRIDMSEVRPKSAPISKPAPVSSKSSGGVLQKIDGAGYATAINRAIENESKPKVVTPPPKVEAMPGESLLEMARRLAGVQKHV